MKLGVGSDHAGYQAKEHLKRWLAERGHEVEDVGTHGTASVDYPDYAGQVGRLVASGEVRLGVLVCGSGIGMSIAANKVRGVRAAVCSEPFSSRHARMHNDANVLCLGARVTGLGLMEDTLEAFLGAAFEGGRHEKRVEKIQRLEGASGC
jgi:ribose 5-phosphate isomerase B